MKNPMWILIVVLPLLSCDHPTAPETKASGYDRPPCYGGEFYPRVVELGNDYPCAEEGGPLNGH